MALMSRFLSDKSYDTLLADVWSLGLILAQLLVGLNKLDNIQNSVSAKKVAAKIGHELRDIIAERDVVRDLIEKMLRSGPKRRYTVDLISQRQWIQIRN